LQFVTYNILVDLFQIYFNNNINNLYSFY